MWSRANEREDSDALNEAWLMQIILFQFHITLMNVPLQASVTSSDARLFYNITNFTADRFNIL